MATQNVQKIEIGESGTYILVRENEAERRTPADDLQNRFLSALGVEVFGLGFLIKHFRELKEWTLRDLDEKTGIPFSQISNYENGKKIPEPESIRKLERELGDDFRVARLLAEELSKQN